jgi:carbamate kinase
MKQLAVIAIGGNSLIKSKDKVSIEDQYEAVKETATHIVDAMEMGYNVVVTHGNGPQVGYILRRSEIAQEVAGMHPVPLANCGADTQGAIGYQLQMALDNEFQKAGIKNKVATIVTQVEVAADDPSFNNPTKPIGTFMTEEDAKDRTDKMGWVCKEDSGRGWRRVVASPKPKAIVELDTVKTLCDSGLTVIAAGGGGIPDVRDEKGMLSGREAVIDKDLAAALMAKQLGADLFVISTAVEKVCLNFGKPNQINLDTITVAEGRQYVEEGHFAPGSMLPKIQAVLDYVETTGNMGLITDPANIYEALHGNKGTKIVK